MREILFRGKQKDNGKWIEGFFFHPTGVWVKAAYKGEPYMIANCENISTTAEVVRLETIGQHTGLTDKNGNKIFEGDIVQADGIREEVRFEDSCFYPMGAFIARSGFCYDKNDYEIIGNIHDNPELLKDKN